MISRGKEQAETTSVAVPGVTGLTEDAARSAIQNAGLAVGNVSSATVTACQADRSFPRVRLQIQQWMLEPQLILW